MKKTNIIQVFTLGGILAVGLLALGQHHAQAADKGNRGQLSARDYRFACDAAKGGRMEVTLGQLAAEKGGAPAVREFGQRMVQDHQKAGDELRQLLTQKGATLPELSAKKDEKMTEHLRSLNGADFDKAYIKDMVRDHREDVKEFEKEADKADDADLKTWVTKTLPTLQEHLRLAESAETTVTGTKATPSTQ